MWRWLTPSSKWRNSASNAFIWSTPSSSRFVGELTSAVRNKAGDIIEGSLTAVKRQRDTWTFSRKMGMDDPNWQLVATGD